MDKQHFDMVTGVDRPDLMKLNNAVTGVSWPQFMLHDPVAELFPELYEKLPQYQFSLLEKGTDNVIALGNSIPLAYDGEPSDLPDEGWDWAMKTGMKDHNTGKKPNILCALQIVVANGYRDQGVSTTAVELMKSNGRSHGLKGMFAPVRPSMKTLYPLTPIDDYIKWQNDDGLPFDPWMRVHVKCGAKIIKVCPQAMRISGSIAQWEEWTGLRFPQSGSYTIPGALLPVEIDVESDRGLYVEPNVWMHHP